MSSRSADVLGARSSTEEASMIIDDDSRNALPAADIQKNEELTTLTAAEKAVLELLVEGAIAEDMHNIMERKYPRVYEALRLSTGKPTNAFIATNTTNFPPLKNAKRTNTERIHTNHNSKKAAFEFPAARLTARRIMSATDNANHSPPTQNRFGSLSESTLSDETVTAAPLQINQIKNKIKPITMVRSENYKKTLDSLNTLQGVSFHVKISREFVKIFPETETAHRGISQHLKEAGIQHYLIVENPNKLEKVVIRGLPGDIPEEEIKNELAKLEYPVEKVNQLIRRRDGRPLPLYQIQLLNSDKNIYDLETLFYVKIIVEKYRSPYTVQQCFNCQFFHHNSQNCAINSRCVKCGESHKTTECPAGKEKLESPRCCNCGGTHPANYRGCPKFPIKKINLIPNSTPVTPNFSYAQAAKSNLPNMVAPSFIPNPNQSLPIEPNCNSNKETNELNDFQEFSKLINEIKEQLGIRNFAELNIQLLNIKNRIKNAQTIFEKINIAAEIGNLFNATAP